MNHDITGTLPVAISYKNGVINDESLDTGPDLTSFSIKSSLALSNALKSLESLKS